MGKRQKNPKNLNENLKKTDNFPQDKNEISSAVEQKIKDVLWTMNKKNKKKLDEMLWKWEFIEQLRLYFQKQYPMLLDDIENKDKLKIYIDQLKNQGFTIENLVDNAKTLDESFSETESEYDVTKKSITKLKTYCEQEKADLPAGIFDDFARFAKINTTPLSIDQNSKVQKASDLERTRHKFLENEKISLNETSKKETDKIMSPKYAPTNRLLISGAIKKIKKNLPKPLLKDFEYRFPLPITITSEIQTLSQLKNEWLLFLQANQKSIDKDTAKKLDSIKVLNQDLYDEFEHEGIDFDRSKWFSEQEQAFRIVFNKLATRQLFDEVNKKNTVAEIQIQNVAEVFKGFPPYLNDVFKKYAYTDDEIKKHDSWFEKDITDLNTQIWALEKSLKDLDEKNIPDDNEQKISYVKQIKQLRKEKDLRKRKWYAKAIASQNSELGKSLEKLIDTKFDVSKLTKAEQQVFLDDLVENKLKKLLAEWAGEALGVDEERFLEIIKDFFDLNKKELTIPSPNGDITFDCLEKSFLGGPLIRSLEIWSKWPVLAEEDKKNLPLNIKLLLNEDNKDYFEKSPIFSGLFQEFEAKNGTHTINEWYKVRIKNSKWDFVDGYLSNYPPKGNDVEGNRNVSSNADRYLYSKPITRPEDDRELMFWSEDKPVEINKNEEWLYDISIDDRELNLNGDAIWAMLFGSTVGQYAQENNLDTKETKKLEEWFEKLKTDDVYRDIQGNKEQIVEENKPKEEASESKETDDYQKLLLSRKELLWYQTIDDNVDKKKINYGFTEGAKMLIPYFTSKLPPENGSAAYLNIEITKIDFEQKKFKIKITGGETNLGNYENNEQTLDLSVAWLNTIKEAFGKKIYKLPPAIDKNQNNMISVLEQAEFEGSNPSKFFKELERNGKARSKKIGDKNEEIMYFERSETSPWEAMDADPVIETICKVEYNPGKTKPYTVWVLDKKKDSKDKKIKTTMDPINFALFIASKKLSPKTKWEVEKTNKDQKEGWPQQAWTGKKIPVSIGNIMGLFKNVSKKVGDMMKKYEEKQQEDFIDSVMFEGNLMSTLAWLMPTDKLKAAFGKVWEEYMLERDNKVWAKIENYVKIFESDPDFGWDKMRWAKIQPFLEGKIPFKDHWQAAAMLLATTKKGKWPYSRNTDRAGKWMWIKILMGQEHQDRYLKMKEKLEKELQEGINLHGQQWANDKQNEILKLEMKYIVHVVDGRQLRWTNEDVALQEGKFSKKFASDLEERSNTFFKDTASSAYNNTKDISFELARFEYFRLLWDRPQQAIANLKAVAEKAVTTEQFKVFESMVLTGMLSGVFNSITQEDKKFIEKVCRAAWFLPWLLNRQPNVHHKIAKLLKIATGKNITYGEKKDILYNPAKFEFWKLSNTNQAKDFVNYNTGFNSRYMDNSKHIKAFLSLEGGNADGKKLIELYEDPSTPNDTKQLLWEILGKRDEKNEELDSDVKANGKSLQQNILCRNQSLIDEIIKFQDGSFKGKDKDAIEDAKATRKQIKDKISDTTIENKTDAAFMIKMFCNWFEDKWFNSERKKFLIRLLKTVKQEKARGNDEWAKKMLRYSIVGKIIKSSGNGQVPDELKEWLEAFNNFFEKNIDLILTKDVINEGFGSQYLESLDKEPFKVAPWEEYVKVTDYNKSWYSVDLSKEENQEMTKKRKLYSNDMIYVNKTIYAIANDLERRESGIPNSLKAMYNPEAEKKTTKTQLQEVLWKNAVSLKNHEKIIKAQKKKENPQENFSDEQLAQMFENGELEDIE